MKTLKLIKQLFLLLCLIMMSAQSAWGYNVYHSKGKCTVGNLSFNLYSYRDPYTNLVYNFAALTGISGTDENVIIPSVFVDGSSRYCVTIVDGTITNNYVKTLTFEDNDYVITFYPTMYTNSDGTEMIGNEPGILTCPNLEMIVFGASINIDRMDEAPLQCPKLKNIVFSNTSAPTLSGSWNNYCTAPGSQVTAYVAAWTQEKCDDMHTNATVWSQFHAVLPYEPEGTIPGETVNVRVSVIMLNYDSKTAMDPNTLSVRKYGDNSEIMYGQSVHTFQVEKGSRVQLYISNDRNNSPYGTTWNILRYYLNGVRKASSWFPIISENIQEDAQVLLMLEPNYFFVPVTNLSAAGTPHSLYWIDDNNVVNEIPPQSTFLVPVNKHGNGQPIYAMEDEHDNYTLRGYWYNGIDYMSNDDQSQGGVHYQDELWQGDEHRLEFTLQPTADLQERQVLIGLVDGAPTSDKLTIKATQGEGGAMGLQYTLDGVAQTKW